MVSNPGWRAGRGGLLCSVERCFEFCWRDVAAVAVEAVLVEPVHPGERGQLDLADVGPPSRGVGPVDAFGLVEPVGGLGERVDAPIGQEILQAACSSACRARWSVMTRW